MAGVHASALIRVLWTCRLIAEEADQVIAFESLILQKKRKKTQHPLHTHTQPGVCVWCVCVGGGGVGGVAAMDAFQFFQLSFFFYLFD